MLLSLIFKRIQIQMPFYAVAHGRKVGIFSDWLSCQGQVNGYPQARFKKFSTKNQAMEFIEKYKIKENLPCSSSLPSIPKIKTKRGIKRKLLVDSEETNLFQPVKIQLLEKDSKILSNSIIDHGPIIYTDGACSNNGNKHATAGFGVYWGEDHEDNLSARLEGVPTNNRAEYMAIICALEKAIERGHSKVTIRTDSKLIINSMTLWLEKWRKNNWNKNKSNQPVLNVDLIKRLDVLLKKIPTKFEHVNAHIGIHGNEMADKLARKGCLLPFVTEEKKSLS